MSGADLPGEADRTAGTVAASTAGAVPTPGPRPAGTPGPAPTPAAGPVTPAATASSRSDSAVTRAIAQLDGLPERPLAEHPDVYQQVHEALQGALADIDDA